MINNYLKEKSDTSINSETSDDVTIEDIQEAQSYESNKLISEDTLQKANDFLRELKKKDKM
ncbi:hypothetical protein H5410_043188 [Solanum commersonii]|uniref:Uncharacterized protein n=1 Tax=Solanum commersonii TaxID=4109 RepID=A0A9J5XY52_SOLCO|nr:hypothetical protein H5410_043188 [Solanum commersonii]